MAKAPEKTKKVKRPTAEKRVLQSEKKRLINRAYRSKVHTGIRGFEDALKTKNPEEITKNLSVVYSLMDKAVKKGIFSQNKANRSKARLAAKVVA